MFASVLSILFARAIALGLHEADAPEERVPGYTIYTGARVDITAMIHPQWHLHLRNHHDGGSVFSHLKALNSIILASHTPPSFVQSMAMIRGVSVAGHTRLHLAAGETTPIPSPASTDEYASTSRQAEQSPAFHQRPDKHASAQDASSQSRQATTGKAPASDSGRTQRALHQRPAAAALRRIQPYGPRMPLTGWGYWHQSRVYRRDRALSLAKASSTGDTPTTGVPVPVFPYVRASWTTAPASEVILADTGVSCNHRAFTSAGTPNPIVACDGDLPLLSPWMDNSDWHGHGTQVAGVVVSPQFGIGNTYLRALRIFEPGAQQGTVDAEHGFQQVMSLCDRLTFIGQAGANKDVARLLLFTASSARNPALDHAFETLTSAGIAAVVPASNSAVDACELSPQRVPSVMVAGAIDMDDKFVPNTGSGACVTFLAPGQRIVTTTLGMQDMALSVIDGTSMSAGILAGVAGSWLQKATKRRLGPLGLQHFLVGLADTSITIHGLPQHTTGRVVQRGNLMAWTHGYYG
ncbi:hypothetical protein PYCC9005_004144 [Savitreella phatthalungensis]